MSPVIEDRLSLLDTLTLKNGSHQNTQTEYCIMEAVAFIAGEPWSDAPKCACPVITRFMVNWNDSLPNDEDRTRLLKPLITKIVGTRSTPEVELARVMLCIDWFCREQIPAWFDLVPALHEHAKTLRAAKPIQDWKDFDAIATTLRQARDDAYAAWAAAGAAAGAAAWDAAWDAAGAALKPTTEKLQASAAQLVERMIAITDTKPVAG